MRGKSEIKLLLTTALLFGLAYSAAAQVVVFSNYETSNYLQDGKLHIERTMRLKNVGTNPIIPGELHFKLKELKGSNSLGPAVENFVASSSYGNKLTTTILESKSQTDLVISVWDPLLPGFHYDITASYDLEFNPRGILFYEITVPVEETTIPISQKTNKFYLPDKYKVTYAPEAQVYDEDSYKVVEWTNVDNMAFEYSRVPLPKTGIKAVNMFWVTLIVILIVSFLIARYKRR